MAVGMMACLLAASGSIVCTDITHCYNTCQSTATCETAKCFRLQVWL